MFVEHFSHILEVFVTTRLVCVKKMIHLLVVSYGKHNGCCKTPTSRMHCCSFLTITKPHGQTGLQFKQRSEYSKKQFRVDLRASNLFTNFTRMSNVDFEILILLIESSISKLNINCHETTRTLGSSFIGSVPQLLFLPTMTLLENSMASSILCSFVLFKAIMTESFLPLSDEENNKYGM